jgi:peptidoglycan L-alanyl-D-glutamate endopeptidase CwlK
MAIFSTQSQARLRECHEKLQLLFREVVKHYDCTILCGHRNEADQKEALRAGRSKLDWPKSKHNSMPSLAVDAVPYPIDWNDIKRFYHFAGFVMGLAKVMGIHIRWGGDFNSDLNFKNDNFIDLPHFELVEEKHNADIK